MQSPVSNGKEALGKISFVDSTIRDGAQSLWAMRMTTGMILPIAPVMDRAGFKVIDFTGAPMWPMCVRFLQEDPWEKFRLICKAIRMTPLNCWMRPTGLAGFTNDQPVALADLWIKRWIAQGIRRITFHEAENDYRFGRISHFAELARAEGAKTVLCLVYSLSPVHTDEYYARKTREAVETGVDGIEIKDPGGLLTPERTRTLVPTVQRNAPGVPLEFHSHATTGLAPLSYLEAIKLGIETVRSAVPPLANGTSMPSTVNILKNIRHLGYCSDVNEEALKAMADHFSYVAKREGLPIGTPVEYDLSYYDHQVPGGVMATLKWQLAQLRLEHRLDEVLHEVARVRMDIGYPIMVTPASQFIVAQAALNVAQGERYKVVLDEVIMKVMGYSGKVPGPIDQNVMDRIMSLPRAKELTNWEPAQPSLQDLRRNFGSEISDDELLLRSCVAEEHIRALRKAGPMRRDYPRGDRPLVSLLKELGKRSRNLQYVSIRKRDWSLVVKKDIP
jgi:oxaloacetate decarboxylase alpha subunit